MKKLFFILLSCIALSGCASAISQESEPASKTDFILNTICQIKIYEENNADKTAEELIDEAFNLCRDYENILSRTIEDSDVYKINHAGGKPVEVSDATIEVVSQAEYYSELSDGAFDITIAPLSILWDFQGENPTVPPEDEIKELLNYVDYTGVEINGNTITLKNPKAEIDLGGIAKGYIADKTSEYLAENGVTSATINLGGNVFALGSKPDGSDFNIGIQDPSSDDGSIIGYVSVSDKSLVTSGSYERYFIQDGKLYHHILDPKTGYPVENGLTAVSIISDKSVDGDGLSTTCFVLDIDKGIALINSIDNVEAIFIDKDGNLYFSDGFDSDLVFNYAE